MRAAGAFPARFERVPARPAAAVEEFRRVAIDAPPTARGGRFPVAVRAANALEIRFFFVCRKRFENFFHFRRYFVSHKAFLKLINQNLSIKEINFKDEPV
jgi:hypothetical protein